MYRSLAGPLLCKQSFPKPTLKPNHVAIRVKYAGVNRLDILQRKGKYASPQNGSPILGVEVAGIITETLSSRFNVGNKVIALLSGGGYSDYVVVEDGLCMPAPEKLTLEQAACIPEHWLTAYLMIQAAGLTSGDQVLVHAASSGVGMALIQVLQISGCKSIICLSGNDQKKLKVLQHLGNFRFINRHDPIETIRSIIMDITHQKGVSVVFDAVGSPVFDLNVSIMTQNARWILYGLLGGSRLSSMDLSSLLFKNVNLKCVTLRSQSNSTKATLIAKFQNNLLPYFDDEKLKVIHDSTYPWTDVEKAHAHLKSNLHIGKILLKVT